MSKNDKGKHSNSVEQDSTGRKEVIANQKDFEGLAELFSINGIIHRGSVCDPSKSRRAGKKQKA